MLTAEQQKAVDEAVTQAIAAAREQLFMAIAANYDRPLHLAALDALKFVETAIHAARDDRDF